MLNSQSEEASKRMKNFIKLAAITLISLLGFVGQSSAHESRPLFVEVAERGTNAFSVNWKIPPSASNVPAPTIVFPDSCKAQSKAKGSATVKQQFFHCQSDLSGQSLKVNWPAYNPSISTLFRFERLSGEIHSGIIGPDTMEWQIPNKEDGAEIAGQYFVLGIEHILMGFDHLLFVACLIFIAGSIKRIFVTVTGFTIAHSITLALAALDVVRLPIAAVESVIALSIIFLAYEIARVYLYSDGNEDHSNTLTWRYPVIVASSFGLLHGFGFASVLNEIGLPQTELPTALLFFNLGVEFGQILFIVACIVLGLLIKKVINKSSDTLNEASTAEPALEITTESSGNQQIALVNDMPKSLVTIMIYAIGFLSTYWLFDRLTGIFS